jgi:hypothetical protein
MPAVESARENAYYSKIHVQFVTKRFVYRHTRPNEFRENNLVYAVGLSESLFPIYESAAAAAVQYSYIALTTIIFLSTQNCFIHNAAAAVSYGMTIQKEEIGLDYSQLCIQWDCASFKFIDKCITTE